MTILRRMTQVVEDLKALNVIDSFCEIYYKSNDDYHEITIKRRPLHHEKKETIRQSFKDEFSSSANIYSDISSYITCTINTLMSN